MCDEYVLHDPVIDELKVIGAKCNLEVNKTGSLTFQIAPTHPYYDKIKKHTSEITLYQDDRMLFCGRVLNDEITFDNIKNIECEGELSYFLDSVQRGKEYHLNGGTENVIETYLQDVVAIHNSQVDERKQFTVGLVNITDPNNYLYKISNYEDTLTTLTDKLLDTYGGYLVVRHSDGVRYLDYVNELTNVCNQTIEFGKNIIDMTRQIKGEDIYTALIPLGAKKETNKAENEATYEKRLTITGTPHGVSDNIVKTKDYIYDYKAVQKWGWIWKVKKWDDVTVVENLLKKAKNELKNSINSTLSVEMTAVDLHLLDVDIDRISVGDNIQCVSPPHNLNITMIVKSVEIDIDNPENTKIKLVSPTEQIKSDKTITSNNNNNEKDTAKIKNELNEDYTTYNDVNNTVKDLKDWVSDNFYPATGGNVDLSDYAKNADVDTKINDLKDWTNDNYVPRNSTSDLSAYAKIVDVNNAFSELATALEGV